MGNEGEADDEEALRSFVWVFLFSYVNAYDVDAPGYGSEYTGLLRSAGHGMEFLRAVT